MLMVNRVMHCCVSVWLCLRNVYIIFCLLFPDLQIRNNFRHYFLSSVPLKIAYDVVTWAVTQLAVCYTVAPFVMLAVEPTIKFYK